MLCKPDLVADIELLLSSEGGRHAPISGPFYGCPLGFGGEYFDCRLDLTEVGAIAPGGHARVPVKFLSRDLIVPRLCVGAEFTLWEGKTIGRGTVVQLDHETAV